jgi:DNA-binding NarL/FixJ family response regulator
VTTRSRILLAEDRAVMAEQLKAVLEPEFEVVATVADGDTLLEAAACLKPDVIVTDIMMPRLNGIAAATEIMRRNPAARIVVVTIFCDRETTLAGLAAGVLGYVLKAGAAEDLPLAVRAALRGERHLSANLRRWIPLKEKC